MGLSNLFKPKWKNSDWKVRKAAVQIITDQVILAEVAKNDEDSMVRMNAVEKLTDQTVLADIAKNDRVTEVSVLAADMLADKILAQKVYADFAKEISPYGEEYFGYKMISKITNQAILADVAQNANNYKVSVEAIKKITDQTIMTDIFSFFSKHDMNEGKWRKVAAVEKLTDSKLLVEIAQDKKEDINVLLAAVENPNLTDSKLLAEIARSYGADSDRGWAAVINPNLTDQAVLADYAINCTNGRYDWKNATIMIKKLNDQTALTEIAMNSKSTEMRSDAFKKLSPKLQATIQAWFDEDATRKLTDQAILTDIAMNSKDNSVRRAAVENITDQTKLAEVSRFAPSGYWANVSADEYRSDSFYYEDAADIAVKKLTNQVILADLAKTHVNPDMRRAAVKKITDPEILADLAKN